MVTFQTNFIKFERRLQKKWYHIKLSAIIQNFEKQNGDKDYDYRYLRNNCINLKDAIKSYFNGKEETFYTQILPFIIDQALLIEERGGRTTSKFT